MIVQIVQGGEGENGMNVNEWIENNICEWKDGDRIKIRGEYMFINSLIHIVGGWGEEGQKMMKGLEEIKKQKWIKRERGVGKLVGTSDSWNYDFKRRVLS